MNLRKHIVIRAVAVAPCLLTIASACGGVKFEPLDPGLHANGISGDGSTVVGYALLSSGGTEAFRRTADGKIERFGLDGGAYGPFSFAYDVSRDGTIVVGSGYDGTELDGGMPAFQAFRWTPTAGVQPLGFRHASGTSGDGSILIGTGAFGVEQAFVWTAEGGMVAFGTNPQGSPPGHRSVAWGISDDGSTVVGSFNYIHNGQGHQGAFRWTAQSGMEGLGTLGIETHGYSSAYAVSRDGSVIVGSSDYQAFRWTADGGMQSLGTLGGVSTSGASGVSGDGSVVVGTVVGPGAYDYEAFIWDSAHGMRSLRDVLVNSNGLNLDGWSLMYPRDISLDGLTIFGDGRDPAGQHRSWIAVVPEPAALPLLTVSAPLLRRRRQLCRKSSAPQLFPSRPENHRRGR